MNRTFIHTPKFLQTWRGSGLSEEDLRELELDLLKDPESGDLIPGTGGIRKARISANGKGTKGGGRVLYADFKSYAQTYLLYFILKSEQEDLSPDQKKALAVVVKKIEEVLRTNKKGNSHGKKR